jgi:hypothetical protein
MKGISNEEERYINRIVLNFIDH